MKDFYEQFRENLENRPEPDYQQNWWDRMEQDLDKEEQKNPTGAAWWWAAAAIALFLLLGTNSLFFMELQKSNERLATLEMRTDTIYQTKIIYQTDTIYQTRTIREKAVQSNATFAHQIPNFKQQAYAKFSPNIFDFLNVKNAEALPSESLSSAVSLLAFHRQKKEDLGKANASANLLDKEKSILLEDLNTLSSTIPFLLNTRTAILPEINIKYKATKRRKSLREYLYPMRPSGLRLGVVGGSILPFGEDLGGPSGYTIGLEADIEFSQHWQLWVNASFYKLHFQLNEQEGHQGIPVVEPPSDDFIFVKVEVPQPFIQYSAGLQYFFDFNDKWKPFLGAGYAVAMLSSHDVSYDFESDVEGIEWEIKRKSNYQNLMPTFLELRTGVEYDLFENWKLHGRLSYRSQWKKTNLGALDLLSAQMGLYYRF